MHRQGPLHTHHPHHHVGEGCDPQRRGSKCHHKPFLPVGFVTVGDSEVQDETQWPGECPFHGFQFASCGGETKKKEKERKDKQTNKQTSFISLLWEPSHCFPWS